MVKPNKVIRVWAKIVPNNLPNATGHWVSVCIKHQYINNYEQVAKSIEQNLHKQEFHVVQVSETMPRAFHG